MSESDNDKLLRRYRHMMVDSGVEPVTVTDQDLLLKLKGSPDDKFKNIERILSLVPERYWQEKNL